MIKSLASILLKYLMSAAIIYAMKRYSGITLCRLHHLHTFESIAVQYFQVLFTTFDA
ncbi:hypothetical protein [Nostoc sp. DedQUE04]|uniref:hypothetical protein n=1 Tax=Nostoc sp. DedQUE04 TaxID=3075390 RepID=UPI002AD2B536|nr:hypothetical protein [Nostoc sp. DedQUE04]